MESTGYRNRIHISHETAELLRQAGKSQWVTPRKDKVDVKGKGVLETYWLQCRGGSTAGPEIQTDISSSDGNDFDMDAGTMGWGEQGLGTELAVNDASLANASGSKKTVKEALKLQRLIDYNVETMLRLLKQILAKRNASAKASKTVKMLESDIGTGAMVLEEVANIISLPKFDAKKDCSDPDTIEVALEVELQLKEYVTMIAHMYRNNPLHNFEHASHVAMSVNKLLSRIEAPDPVDIVAARQQTKNASELHDHTYGITSDPLTQFSIVLSSLMHDVRCRGHNWQLLLVFLCVHAVIIALTLFSLAHPH